MIFQKTPVKTLLKTFLKPRPKNSFKNSAKKLLYIDDSLKKSYWQYTYHLQDDKTEVDSTHFYGMHLRPHYTFIFTNTSEAILARLI